MIIQINEEIKVKGVVYVVIDFSAETIILKAKKKTCPLCGKEFYLRRKGRKDFCGSKCMWAAIGRRRRGTLFASQGPHGRRRKYPDYMASKAIPSSPI